MKIGEDGFEERVRLAEEEATEILDFYHHLTIAKRLLQTHMVEALCRMTEQDVLELCKPDKCDAAEVVAICIILDRRNRKNVQ